VGLRQSASVVRCGNCVIRLHRATCALVGTATLAGCGAVQAGVQRGVGRYGFFWWFVFSLSRRSGWVESPHPNPALKRDAAKARRPLALR
jgi:hypothetical protein